jgi:hypothetical protein
MSRSRKEDPAYGEARWPMAAAVLASMVLTFLLPDDLRLGPNLMLPVLEAFLLVTLVVGDSGRINRRSKVLRRIAIALVAVLVAGAMWSTGQLVDDLVHGGQETSSATALLEAGSSVWASTVLAFALLYFELDGGGAAARAQALPEFPDLAFPQQLNPGTGPSGWRPGFVDYLYLALTNSTAFSPTDVMPLVPWAKLAMAAESLVSLVIIGLVLARAVNVLA